MPGSATSSTTGARFEDFHIVFMRKHSRDPHSNRYHWRIRVLGTVMGQSGPLSEGEPGHRDPENRI